MKYILTSLVALLAVAPVAASAYTTSAQKAMQIDETTALYSITYSFGLKSHDLYMPRAAVRDQAWKGATSTLGFSILEDGKTQSSDGTAAGVVLSDAALTDDGMYFVPAGTAETFTFFVIMKTEATAPEADYAVQVTDLPFLRGEDKEHLFLTPSELQYYQTPETEFNASNPSK